MLSKVFYNPYSSNAFNNPYTAANRQGARIASFLRNNPPINIDSIVNTILNNIIIRLSQIGLYDKIYQRVSTSILPQLGYSGPPPSQIGSVLFFISYSLATFLSRRNTLSVINKSNQSQAYENCEKNDSSLKTPACVGAFTCVFFVLLYELYKKFQGSDLATILEEIQAKIVAVNPDFDFPPTYIVVEEILKIVYEVYNNT